MERPARWPAPWLVGMTLMICNAHATSVYQCTVNGQRIFSDQPCGADAQQHEITDSNRMQAPHVPAHKPRTRAQAKTKAAATTNYNDRSEQRAQCRRIGEQTDNIHAQQRAGYNAAQGARLRKKLDELKARYRQQRCEQVR